MTCPLGGIAPLFWRRAGIVAALRRGGGYRGDPKKEAQTGTSSARTDN